MNKKSEPKKKHPIAQLIGALISVGVVLLFLLAGVKALIPPIFSPAIRDFAFWDICSIIVLIVIAMLFFKKDFEPEEEEK